MKLGCHFLACAVGWGIKENLKIGAVFLGVALVLAGVAFGLRRSPRRIGCGRSFPQIDVTSLATAVNQYHTEYGKLPGVAERVTTASGDGVKLLNILCCSNLRGIESQNPRSIKFLSLVERKNNRRGLVYDSTGRSVVGFYDDWGNPITVVLDTDGDKVLEFKLGSREIRLEGRSVAVVSRGKDQKLGTADDVQSW